MAGMWAWRGSPASMLNAQRAAIRAAATGRTGRFIPVGPVRTDPTQIQTIFVQNFCEFEFLFLLTKPQCFKRELIITCVESTQILVDGFTRANLMLMILLITQLILITRDQHLGCYTSSGSSLPLTSPHLALVSHPSRHSSGSPLQLNNLLS